MLKTKFFTSLDKIYPDTDWPVSEETQESGRMLANERFSFQLAYRFDEFKETVKVKVETGLPGISVRRAELVPAQYVRPANADDNFERTLPGLFPDPLIPLPEDGSLLLCPNGARALWITADGACMPETGEDRSGEIRIRFVREDGRETLAEAVYHLTVMPDRLPEQKLLFTQWFHTDCLSHWYRVPALSEEWWKRVEQFLSCAARNGMNLVLTPVFTPPLDTAPGIERLTVQLVRVRASKGKECTYTFDFTDLKRWIAVCEKCGITHFEISHLFTQWGAGFSPKIMAEVNGRQERIFGWETKADSAQYRAFLDSFLPALVDFLRKEGVLENCFFHVSDEPEAHQLEAYRTANEMVKKHIGGRPIMDAISDYSFYENGLIDLPVCATNHIDVFLKNGTKPLFAYYCCSQTDGVSNRLFGMPQVRNRAIGIQLYATGVEGFLHWGYNYWLSPGSRRPIDPYATTDCESTFPAGDSFCVYPGEDGPVESARLAVFYDALQDIRLLELLEDRFSSSGADGRKAVIDLLQSWPYCSFDQCPADAQDYWKLRDMLLEKLRSMPKA